jgi:hypothetical protein
MRKLIDIPDNLVRDLKGMAFEADMNFKNYIESVLVLHAGGGLKTKTLNKLNSNKKGKN